MKSTSIADQRVYAQNTEPTDTRDGILWVDTSVSPRETFVYSTDTGEWEPTQISEDRVSEIAWTFSEGFAPGYLG